MYVCVILARHEEFNLYLCTASNMCAARLLHPRIDEERSTRVWQPTSFALSLNRAKNLASHHRGKRTKAR